MKLKRKKAIISAYKSLLVHKHKHKHTITHTSTTQVRGATMYGYFLSLLSLFVVIVCCCLLLSVVVVVVVVVVCCLLWLFVVCCCCCRCCCFLLLFLLLLLLMFFLVACSCNCCCGLVACVSSSPVSLLLHFPFCFFNPLALQHGADWGCSRGANQPTRTREPLAFVCRVLLDHELRLD